MTKNRITKSNDPFIMRAEYIDAINQEKKNNLSLQVEIEYILNQLKYISDRVKEIKKKHSSVGLKFWLSALFDSQLRKAVSNIIHFDYEYTINSTQERIPALKELSSASINGRERKELFERVQESGSL